MKGLTAKERQRRADGQQRVELLSFLWMENIRNEDLLRCIADELDESGGGTVEFWVEEHRGWKWQRQGVSGFA